MMISVWWVATDGDNGLEVEHFTTEKEAVAYARTFFLVSEDYPIIHLEELENEDQNDAMCWQVNWGEIRLSIEVKLRLTPEP